MLASFVAELQSPVKVDLFSSLLLGGPEGNHSLGVGLSFLELTDAAPIGAWWKNAKVLTKPSISQQQLQGLVEAFESTGGDASAVRYLSGSQTGWSWTV